MRNSEKERDRNMKTEKILNMIVKDFVKYQDGKRARQGMVGRCKYGGTDLIGYTPERSNAYFLLPTYFPFDIEKLATYEMDFNAFTKNVPLEKLKNTNSKLEKTISGKKTILRVYKTPDGKNVYFNDKLFAGFDSDVVLTGSGGKMPAYVWEGGSIGNAFPAGLVMPTYIGDEEE